jgi:hypothetical protein
VLLGNTGKWNDKCKASPQLTDGMCNLERGMWLPGGLSGISQTLFLMFMVRVNVANGK